MGKITEYSGSRKERQKLFSQAGAIAVRDARNNELSLTYASGNKILKESPDGNITVIAVLKNSSDKLPRKFIIK